MLQYEDEPNPLHDEQANRTPRLAAILFGVTIQVVTGILAFTLPPGGSVTTWLIYIALGAVGVLHILMGAFSGGRMAEGLAVTADFESDDIPWHAKRCPACDGEIADALKRGQRRCPSCDSHFSTRDLGWRSWDPAGEPGSLSPHERRISGKQAVTLLAVLAMLLMAVAVIAGLSAGIGSPMRPGP